MKTIEQKLRNMADHVDYIIQIKDCYDELRNAIDQIMEVLAEKSTYPDETDAEKVLAIREIIENIEDRS